MTVSEQVDVSKLPLSPFVVLLRLRYDHGLTLGWDRDGDRIFVRPGSYLREHPEVIELIERFKHPLKTIVQWEEKHQRVAKADDDELALLVFLYEAAELPLALPSGTKLHPWATLIEDESKLVNRLLSDVALGPAGIRWRPALDDIRALKEIANAPGPSPVPD